MNPIKTLLTVTVTAALALPAAALAEAPAAKSPSSAKQCKTLRTQMGTDGFKAAYGTNKTKSNAFGKCVSTIGKAAKTERAATVESCRTERSADAAAFAAKYGTNKNKKNAFGKCVSGQNKKDAAEVRSDQRSAAKDCKAERSADEKAFAAKYGTNKNKSNAFGKCVSATAKANAAERNKDDDAGKSGDTTQNDTNPGQSKKQSS